MRHLVPTVKNTPGRNEPPGRRPPTRRVHYEGDIDARYRSMILSAVTRQVLGSTKQTIPLYFNIH